MLGNAGSKAPLQSLWLTLPHSKVHTLRALPFEGSRA